MVNKSKPVFALVFAVCDVAFFGITDVVTAMGASY